MRVAFFTLGCKVNRYETEAMTSRFAADGFDVVSADDIADVYVINSCTVTGTGDRKTLKIMRRMRRLNPVALIALTGCFPQAFPEKAESFADADILQGTGNRNALLENVKTALLTKQRIVDIVPHEKTETFESLSVHSFQERTRAFVKIEDGCDRYCSYCIIPKARGAVRSKSPNDIKAELLALSQNGYKEIVLVGINLSSYGKETGYQYRLPDAAELAAQVPGIERVRLGSLEPELLTPEDLDRLAALQEFCPQFHLSLQSGSDQTLSRMNRRYTVQMYRDLTEQIRQRFDNPAVTTDIMIGFPGEDEQAFRESLNFVKEIGFAKTHVFAYSKREGTAAAEMDNHLSKAEKEVRSRFMLLAANDARKAFLLSQIHTLQEVLFETRVSSGVYGGYTKNYTRVTVESDEDLCGKILPVTIEKAESDHCVGLIK